MTSIIKFQALSGSWGESPPCYILQIDEFRFLLDCGWDDRLGLPYLEEIKKHVQKIDAVLLSYPDLLHLGGLPVLVGRLGLSCPVYATVPVHKMGHLFLYDYYLGRHGEEEFRAFDLDDVDLAFDSITQLKYNQSVILGGKGAGLTIVPLPAGHMIGGTVWKIMKVGEEDVYYGVDFNHKKERHLNGCELDRILKPSLFITDAYNANYIQARRRTRDEQLLAGILHTLRNGGNVLVAVDTAGRVLELAHMLEQLWRSKESGLHPYQLALLNHVSYNVVEFAKLQIEWMSDKLMRSFEGARNNPFQFKHLNICHSILEVQRISSPKVVLASTPDLEYGFAREIFTNWCQDKKNCVILTSRPSEGTLGRLLIENPSPGIVELEVRKRVELKGRELESHYRQIREEEYRVKKEKKMVDSEDSSDDSDLEVKLVGMVQGTARVNHDLFIKAGMETKIETGSLFKASRGKYPMFPHAEEKIRFDDYGEFIKQDDYFLIDNIYEKEAIEKSKRVDNDDDDIEIELPTKCVSQLSKFDIQCSIVYIDFEGRSDGESIHKILEHMKPRRLIITRGKDESVNTLIQVAGQVSPETVVYSPQLREVLDVTSETHIYQVKLKDALVTSLEMQRGKDAELAWVEGLLQLEFDTFHGDNKEKGKDGNGTAAPEPAQDMEVDEDEKEHLVACLEPLLPGQTQPHPTVFVNELKLSDFKQVLARHGLPSEFSGGVLWCAQGTLALRRQDAGKLTLEGTISDDYYRIRDLLYDQYAIL